MAIVDHQVTTAKVQTSLVDMDQCYGSSDPGSEMVELLEGLVPAIGQYPHLSDTTGIFDPYLATVTINNFCHVDEDYLLRNLHKRPTLDMSGIKWKPQEIEPYYKQRRAHFDIETEGLNYDTDAVTMVGIHLAGEFGVPNAKWAKEFEAAKTGGVIFTYNLESHEKPKKGFHTEKMKSSVKDGDEFKEVEKTYGVLYCDDEVDMLKKMWAFLQSCDLSLVTLHNGYEFDCIFLTQRCEMLKIDCPWTTVFTVDRVTGEEKKKVNTAASVNGEPLKYFPTYWAKPNREGKIWNDGSFPQIIDTRHLAGQHDKLAGDMEGYSLKYIAADYLGKRDGRRLELSYGDMMSAWKGGKESELKKYREYLIFDLEDQEIISEFFMPNVWPQQMFMPLPVQEISVASPARKWNAILSQVYKPLYGERHTVIRNGVAKTIKITRPETDDKVRMEGAISRVSPGIYSRFYKVDVASLYPSIMLRWVLADPRKDPLGIMLYILLQARSLRYHYKRLGNEAIEKAMKQIYKSIDSALKVLLNGGFGFTGAGGYPFNSMATAALITAFGRILMRLMMHVCCKYHRVIEVDTDGLLLEITSTEGPVDYECLKFTKNLIASLKKKIQEIESEENPDDDAVRKLGKLKKDLAIQKSYLEEMCDETKGCRIRHTPEFVHAAMQAVLPSGSDAADASDIEKVGIVLELEEIYPEGVIYAPKAKNYVKFANANAKPSVKGIYRKRNRTPLQKTYLVEYIRILAFYGYDEAVLYRNAVINAIRDLSASLATRSGQIEPLPLRLDSGKYSVTLSLRDITATHRIPSNGKWLMECNLGEAGGPDKVSYYWGHLKLFGKPTKAHPGGRPIKGKPFPVRVSIDDQWNYEVNPQHIPSVFNPEHISYGLDYERYEAAFLKSIAEIDAVIAVGKQRTSMTINDEDLQLPAWYAEELAIPF